MFEPNLSIDVSLLAIILGSYATKSNRNLTLLLICLLFTHVLLTNEKEKDDLSVDETGNDENENENVNEDEEEDQRAASAASAVGAVGAASAASAASAVGAASAASAASAETAETAETAQSLVTVPQAYKSTVSAGVFDRQLSTPQTNLTSTVFPSTSVEANGKLASARGSFFKSLVS